MAPAQKTDGKSIASLICGIASWFCLGPITGIPGIILGVLGLKATSGTDAKKGRGLAIAGIVLSILGSIAIVAGLAVFLTQADDVGDALGDTVNDAIEGVESGLPGYYAAGDCVTGANQAATEGTAESADGVVVADCSEPHDGEVFFVGNSQYTEFPGDDAIFAENEDMCLANFESYVAIAYELSEFEIVSLYPTQSSWEAGDREQVCIAVRPEGADLPLESIRGSGQ